LLKGVARREFDIVAAWSACRLGRSLPDLVSLLGELQAHDIDLYLHQQALDTSTPSGKMLFGMLGVFSEFEQAMIRDRGWLVSIERDQGRHRSRSIASAARWMRGAVSERRRGA
jgi:DNA invertase Pin-like site-specific DNA recombinase